MKKLILLFTLFVAFTAVADDQPALVVVVSVDQLRFDLVDRFDPWFSENGFRRFKKSGAMFPNARYRYAVTFTGPGHASIGTGNVPAQSGIVGNTWFERNAPVDAKKWEWYFDDSGSFRNPDFAATPFTAEGDWWWKRGGSPRYCAYDDRVQPTEGATSGMSPASLSEDALGDRVKEGHPGSRVIAVALKDRAAILMGGRRADAAYWFDYRLPAFISSTYYRFDPAVFTFNKTLPGYLTATKQWTPSPFLPAADLARVTFDPPEAWPLKNTRYGGTFPHIAKDMRGFTYSPLAHQMLLDFAQHVIATENLGSGAGPDLLYVGISSTDYIGHYYGPDSMEVADSMVRLDRSLAQFFDALERRFGNRVIVALTADHGVQSNPEIVKLRDPKADAGRIDLRNPDPKAQRISDLPPVRIEIERQAARRLRLPFSESAPLDHTLVYFFEEPALYLNWKHIAELKLDGERVKRAVRDAVAGLKENGIDDVWTSTEILSGNPNPTPQERLMRASYRSDRSGDVLMTLRPGWIWTWGSNSTTHGQPVDNDMHVPLLLYGPGIRPGVYTDDASPLDLAKTLGALLGVEAGGNGSHVLACVER